MSLETLIENLTLTKKINNDFFNLTLSGIFEINSILKLLPKIILGYEKANFVGSGKLKIIENEKNSKKQRFKRRFNLFIFHGYGMNEKANPLALNLAKKGYKIFSLTLPFLKSIEEQAEISERFIIQAYLETKKEKKELAIIGYSMGGLVGKLALSKIKFLEILYFIAIATPYKGTLTAYFGLGKSAKEMRPNSELVKKIEKIELPNQIKQFSLIPTYDFLVVPPESGLMNKNAINILFPRENHVRTLFSQTIANCIDLILNNPYFYFRKKAIYREFSPSLALRSIKKINPKLSKKFETKEKFYLIPYENL